MIQLAFIIVIIISLVAGFYAVILLGMLRKKYQIEYLNSFFYHQVLLFLFGLYGILGNIIVQQILLKFDIKESNIGSIALFFPFFGVPFMLAAWFLFIKMTSDLRNKKMPQILTIAYFIAATAVFLVYGRQVQKMPNIDYHSMTSRIVIVFYTIDMLVALYFSILIFLHSFGEKIKSKRIYLVRLGFLVGLLAILRAASMHFSHYHFMIGLYFILLFFAGNLVTIFLTKVYLFSFNADFQNSDAENPDLFAKYGISNREKEIIREICKGKTNQQIADDLFISLQTVKDHIYNIFRKVDVKNRVQLTKLFNP